MKQQKLQTILFPKPGICTEDTMYYRLDSQKVSLNAQEEKLTFERKAMAIFDTYFNGFSIGKWKKYTNLGKVKLKLKLKGSFIVTLTYLDKINAIIFDHPISAYEANSDEVKEFDYEFNCFDERGMYTFKLQALEDDSEFYGGYYFTDIADSTPDVVLAINMCTYKLDRYIYQNVDMLNQRVFHNDNCTIKDNLYLFITDNGRTIDQDKVRSDKVHIVSQPDMGSAGGFARGMMEVLDAKDKYNITHIIMMDDDVLLDPETLERNYAFMLLIKDEYKKYVLGGAMLRLDCQYLQHESGGWFDEDGYHTLKGFFDLRNLDFVLDNCIDEGAEINAWWYCCIPIENVSDTFLPFPLFFHRDDMEFGKRMGGNLILLNGICLWHEAFQFKTSFWRVYYDIRNLFIINALYFPEYDFERAKKVIRKDFFEHLFCYHYKSCDIVLSAIEDFCRGIDWMVENDSEQFMDGIIARCYKLKPLGQLPVTLNYDQYIKGLTYNGESKFKRFVRKCSLNGYLLPAKWTVSVHASYPLKYNFFRAKTVMNYDEITQTGYITEKSIPEVIRLLKRYAKVMKFAKKNYNNVRDSYFARKGEMTTKSFWKNYLKLEEE